MDSVRMLNKRHNRNNDGRTTRKTPEPFQLATAVFSNPHQNFGINQKPREHPSFVIDFMKEILRWTKHCH